VRRESDPADLRRHRLALTAAGRLTAAAQKDLKDLLEKISRTGCCGRAVPARLV